LFSSFYLSPWAVFIQWEGKNFDPIREIQRLKNQGYRDDALDFMTFLNENQLGDSDKIRKLEKNLDYGFLEMARPFAWKGIAKGEVSDAHSGIGSLSADLTLFGDLRDLLIQTLKRIRGDPDAKN
jgi:hypothetical protein